MFETAMNLLGLTDADKSRVIMVGNNLKRDICGANRFGITSVHLAWTERYPKIPACPEEQPDYTILTPDELPALVERLNAQLAEEETK